MRYFLFFLLGFAIAALIYFLLRKPKQGKLFLSASQKSRSTSVPEQNTSKDELQYFVKRGNVDYQHNLSEEKTLNLGNVLDLLDEYKNNKGNMELMQAIKKELETHNEHGENALHAYLHEDHVELEKIEEMVELNHELLTEENAEGDTALHLAERHGHHEAAEWMVEEERFSHAHERHHFLAHHNHHGHTALHDSVHLWHYHPHSDHFFHMVEKHPMGALLWEDKHGKTVYEHFFENPHHSGHKLLEALEHKGVLHYHNHHYELTHEAEKVLHSHNKKHASKFKLLVQQYSQLHAKQHPESKQKTDGKKLIAHQYPKQHPK